jgi:UDP-N-acetylglucosamine 2-epimerase (non-hydrolysing)
VDHISDINLTYSDIAREYLLREGLSPDRVVKTGSPMFEVLHHYFPQIEKSDVLERLQLEKGKYFVVSAHREENISNDRTFFGLLEALNRIAETYGYPVIVSTHPRTRKRLEQLNSSPSETKGPKGKDDSSFVLHELIQWQKPLGFSDYNALQMHSYAVLSDSGTISEESSILNFRALNIREAHERPEAMEEASVMMVGLDPIRIMQGLKHLEHQENSPRNTAILASNTALVSIRSVADYSMPNVSEKVVRIILSYTDYINRVVWKK